jgi:hypothetical protein
MHYSTKELFWFMLMWMMYGAVGMYFLMHILLKFGIHI